MQFFLIDRVTELEVGRFARGIKNITLTDEVLYDHFPDYPILPGLLILEAASQLAGFLLEVTLNREGAPLHRALLAQVDLAKFHEPARPGDQLEVHAIIGPIRDSAAQVRTEIHVGQKRIAQASLMFIMKQVDSDRLHEQRRKLYRIWTRDLNPPPTIL